MSQSAQVSIIDDDESMRTALVGLVRSYGYSARAFESGEAYLRSDARACDCIITDIHMPGLSGFDLKRRLTGERDETPVIMITARTEPALRLQASDCGAVCLLQKPFQASDLVSCIERALATP